VTFDLTGLPPTPSEIDAFVRDTSPKAYEKLLGRLLASPAFGETWGRHWLDVARYAESSGKEQNMLYPFAWRYRDYVIDSFNTDKPYDVFVKEQLAGDLLKAASDSEKAEQIIATGFLAVGPKSHNELNAKKFQVDVADEQIDAFSQGMLGLTVACARCHDHKFDPIPTQDYYALAGIFTSSETQFGTASGIQARQSAPLVELPLGAKVPAGSTLEPRELERMKTKLAELRKELDEVRAADKKSGNQPARALFLLQQISVTEKQLSHYTAAGEAKKLAMGMADRATARDMPILARGELERPAEAVKRGTVRAVSDSPLVISRGSGRKELAEWVASPSNPLTARVYVNRLWLHLFGHGLVTSPDNFGTTGVAPSHPELLDYLATRLVAHKWSTKSMLKELMLTAAYRQSSDDNAAAHTVDPDNVTVWRMTPRRLPAEALRDAMLAISGTLDMTRPAGSPVQKYEGNVAILQRTGGLEAMLESRHRSVYLPILRDNVPESLELFDFAEPSLVTGQRDQTSVPSQALYLLNSPQVLKLSEATATRLNKTATTNTDKITTAYRWILGRTPTERELTASTNFLAKMPAKKALPAYVQALYATAEFRYLR
jgi:hypothetical protein